MFKQKITDLLVKIGERFIEEHYTLDVFSKSKNTFNMAISAVDNSNQEIFEKINEYVARLMQELAKEIYEQHKDSVSKLTKKNIKKIVDDLLSEAEAEEFYVFAMSQTGQKVLRNFDLFKDTANNSKDVITTEIIKKWECNR